MQLAAQYLDVPGSQVRRGLRAGKSLSEIVAATPGKSEAALLEVILAARVSRLTDATAAGRLSRAAEQKRLAALRSHLARELARAGGPAVVGADVLEPVARYLGLSLAQLHQQLPGHSLAQVADGTPGRSAAGLVAALAAEVRARLQARVSSGRLSSTAAAERLASLTERVTARVDREHLRRTHARRARHA